MLNMAKSHDLQRVFLGFSEVEKIITKENFHEKAFFAPYISKLAIWSFH